MSKSPHSNHPVTFRPLLSEAWESIVETDDVEPDEELIAAFVDGRLAPVAEARLAEHILESPRAFSLLRSVLPPGRSLPQPQEHVETETPTVSQELIPSQADSQRASQSSQSFWKYAGLGSFALAACLCIAIVLGYRRLTQVEQNYASKETERNEALLQVAQLETENLTTAKIQLAQVAAHKHPIFLGENSPPSMVTLSLTSLDRSRAIENPTKLDQQYFEACFDFAQQTLDKLDNSKLEIELERAMVLIYAGRFEKANKLLTKLETNSPNAPSVLNARGVWNATRAEELPLAEGEAAVDIARQQFQAAGTAGFSMAWLNLALLETSEGNPLAARQYAEQFLTKTDELAAAKTIREWLVGDQK
ncbi:MAG: hypothetical protein KDA84_26970 [Planctomycetaceae bacterium]|nr:hypothetical protein [Planctomycetaceae bacterium]